MSSSPLPSAAHTTGRVFAWVLGALLVAAVVGTAWIGIRGATAYGHLVEAQRLADGTATTLRDPAAAASLVDRLSNETAAAHELTSDPVWAAAEQVPWIGPQLGAVATVAAALDQVASESLRPLTEVAAAFSVDDLRPIDGRIDLAAFTSIAGAADSGASGLSAASSAVDQIEREALLGPVRDAVDEVSALLAGTADGADALARATTLLPAMLGADGPRDYLIVFQNNAEWRSLGGIVGAMAVVHTDDGAMTMTAQGSSSDFPRYTSPVLEMDPEMQAVFKTHPARWIQNVTQSPDFSVTGPLAREMWLREMGQEVDGVIAMDPVALSYLLKATGPVKLPTGDELTADNAVQLLLNDVYMRYERPAEQDAFFAAAAAAVFGALSAGDSDPTELVAALGRAGDERRLLLWSAIDEDQAVLEGTTLTGPLPITDDEQLGFGVYLNDSTGSKMDYYVSPKTTLAWDKCAVNEDGRASGTLTLTVTLTNTAPADAATSLPDYITGGGNFGVAPGRAKTIGYVYLPEGAELRDATRTDDQGFGGGFHAGRQVMTFTTDLAPGESVTARFTVATTTPGAGDAVAWVTPTVDPGLATRISDSCTGS